MNTHDALEMFYNGISMDAKYYFTGPAHMIEIPKKGESSGRGGKMDLAAHDKARHHGHFDPRTMTCSLRDDIKAECEKEDIISPSPSASSGGFVTGGSSHREKHDLSDELATLKVAFSGLRESDVGGSGFSVYDLVDFWEESDGSAEEARTGELTGTESPAIARVIDDMKAGRKSKAEVVKMLEDVGVGKDDGTSKTTPLSDEMKNSVFAIRSAAKTVNRHIDRGDFRPNQKKIEALDAHEKRIRGVLSDKSASPRDRAVAAGLLHAIKDIRKSVADGAKTRIGFVKRPDDESRDATGESGYDAKRTERIVRGREPSKEAHKEESSESPASTAIGEYFSAVKKDTRHDIKKDAAKLKEKMRHRIYDPEELSDIVDRELEAMGYDPASKEAGEIVDYVFSGPTVVSRDPEEIPDYEERKRKEHRDSKDWEKSSRAGEIVTGKEIHDIVARKYDVMKEAEEIEKKAAGASSDAERDRLMQDSVTKKNVGYALSHFAAKDGGFSSKGDDGKSYKMTIGDGVKAMHKYLSEKYAAAVKRHGGDMDKVESSRSIVGIREAIREAGRILGFEPYGFDKDTFSVKSV